MLEKRPCPLQTRPDSTGRTRRNDVILFLIGQASRLQIQSEKVNIIRSQTWEVPTPPVVRIGDQTSASYKRLRKGFDNNKSQIRSPDFGFNELQRLPEQTHLKISRSKSDAEKVKTVSTPRIIL